MQTAPPATRKKTLFCFWDWPRWPWPALQHPPLILQGAELFLLARLVFVPVYYVGITYVRTLVWLAGVVGLIMMLMGLMA